MNVSELRIGNKVKCKTSNDSAIYTVFGLDGLHLKIYLNEPRNKWHETNLIKPISITEKWLKDFGFNIIKTKNLIEARKDNCRYSIQEVLDSNHWFLCDGNTVITNFRYVHELQNLYFFLCLDELMIQTNNQP